VLSQRRLFGTFKIRFPHGSIVVGDI